MQDLISRQAAIKAIENLQDCYNGFSDTYDKACIIGVLEEIPTAQVNTPTDTPTDTISRQAAIDILMKEWKAYKDYPYVSHVRHGLEIAIAILENKVPSAQPEKCEDCGNFNKARLLIPQPERKKGHWTQEELLKLKKEFEKSGSSIILLPAGFDLAETPAKWIYKKDPDYSGGGYSQCENCGARFSWGAYHEPQEFRHCPMCGHRMEVEEDE